MCVRLRAGDATHWASLLLVGRSVAPRAAATGLVLNLRCSLLPAAPLARERSGWATWRRSACSATRSMEKACVGHGGPCGVHARGPVNSSSGVCRGGAEVKPPNGRLRPSETRDGPEHQLLMELCGPTVDGAADKVGVSRLHLTRTENPTSDHSRPESGGRLLHPGLHPVCEAFKVVSVPCPLDISWPSVSARVLRHVRVGPERFRPCGGTSRVRGGHLSGEHERLGGDGVG